MTDNETLDRLKQGDKEALGWLYKQCRDSFVHKLMGWWYNCDEFDAQEIYMESVKRLAAKSVELKNNTSLKTLLWGYCKNVHREWKKGQLKEQNDLQKFVDYEERIGNDLTFSKGFEIKNAIEVMVDALELLKEDCQKILKAHYGIYNHPNKVMLETSGIQNKAITDEAIGLLFTPQKSADAIKMKRRRCEEKLGTLVIATLKKTSNGID